MHAMLAPLGRLEEYLGLRIGFISLQAPVSRYLYMWIPHGKLRQMAYQALKHCAMAWAVLVDSRAQVFLIYECNAPYVFPLLCALACRGKPAFVLMHGIQQMASRSCFHLIGFKLTKFFIAKMNGYGVHLELSDLDLCDAMRLPVGKSFVIPLPHPLAECDGYKRSAKSRREPVLVGAVGMLRKGKNVIGLARDIMMMESLPGYHIKVVVGIPFWQKGALVDGLQLDVRDTGTLEQYEEFLREVDICVFDYEAEEYFFRPSGVIGDALMNGAYVVCPNFPVFRAQVETPVRVGRLYSSREELLEMIKVAYDEIRDGQTDRFDEWRRYRRVEAFAERFRHALHFEAGGNS